MQSDFYLNKVYPLQDEVLSLLSEQVNFYLAGGTAISRFHYEHRFSDDLDQFLNHSSDFQNQADQAIKILQAHYENLEIALLDTAFVRLFITKNNTGLKLEFINVVGFRYGEPFEHQAYWKVDNTRNILSNKLCALTRQAPKDLSVIIEICKHESFNWQDIFQEAQNKDAWVNEIHCVKLIGNADINALATEVNWTAPRNPDILGSQLEQIAKDIMNGEYNTLSQN